MDRDYKKPVTFYHNLEKREYEACKKFINSNEDEINDIEYNEDSTYYRKLERFYMPQDRLLLEKLKDFNIIDNCGKIGETSYFITCRNRRTNKIYIHFFGGKENYIVFLDSDFTFTANSSINKKNYFYNCSLYAIYDLRENQYLETHGLEEKTKNYYHQEWFNKTSHYEITLKQMEDGTYIYEFIKAEEDSIHIRCVWKDYESFKKGEKPKKIEIEGQNKNEKQNKIYSEKEIEENFIAIQSDIYDLGFRFLNEDNKKYIDYGIRINEIYERIIYAAIKKQIDNLNRESSIKKIESDGETQESENESHYQARRAFYFKL